MPQRLKLNECTYHGNSDGSPQQPSAESGGSFWRNLNIALWAHASVAAVEEFAGAAAAF
jgi:hypothetical protein